MVDLDGSPDLQSAVGSAVLCGTRAVHTPPHPCPRRVLVLAFPHALVHAVALGGDGDALEQLPVCALTTGQPAGWGGEDYHGVAYSGSQFHTGGWPETSGKYLPSTLSGRTYFTKKSTLPSRSTRQTAPSGPSSAFNLP